MAGVYKIEISESEAELKELLRQEKTGSGKERIQALYLLKTKKAKTVTEAAEMLGRNRVTVQDWLGKYRQGGLEKLLSKKVSTGRPRKVPQWAEKALEKRLKEILPDNEKFIEKVDFETGLNEIKKINSLGGFIDKFISYCIFLLLYFLCCTRV